MKLHFKAISNPIFEFDPNIYGDVILYVDHTNPETNLKAGGGEAGDEEKIDTVVDTSVTAATLQQTTDAYRPTCKVNYVTGHQVAEYDGTQGFQIPLTVTSTLTRNKDGLTIAFAGRPTAWADPARIFTAYTASSWRVYFGILGSSQGNAHLEVTAQDGGTIWQGDGSALYPANLNQWNIYITTLDFSGNSAEGWQNDKSVLSSVDINSSGATTDTDCDTADGQCLFFNTYGATGYIGQVGELIIWDGAMPLGDLEKMRNKFAEKYDATF